MHSLAAKSYQYEPLLTSIKPSFQTKSLPIPRLGLRSPHGRGGGGGCGCHSAGGGRGRAGSLSAGAGSRFVGD